MSGQATGWVLRHGPGRDDRPAHAVLVTVADAANRDGEHSYPGIQAMMDGSGYTRSTVFDALKRLLAEGYLEVEEQGGGRGRSTVYRIPGVMDPDWYPTVIEARTETVRQPDPSVEQNSPETVQLTELNGPETVQLAPDAPIDRTGTVLNGNGARRGSRLPDAFIVTAEMREWATENVPEVDLRDQTARFCDYWRDQSGARALHLDWVGTWRNWMRRANDDRGRGRGPRQAGTLAQIADMEFDEHGMLL